MTSDDFKGLSDEELERLAFDLEEPKAEPAVEAPAESAPAAPEVPEVTESELSIEDLTAEVESEAAPEADDPRSPKAIQQNLTRALQIERDRRREAESERKQLLEMLQQFQQQPQQTKATPEAEPAVEDAPDPYLDPEAYINYKLEERDRRYQAEIENLKQAQIASKIQSSEEDLKAAGKLEEYHKLVNLSDPNHPFARMVSQTPNLLDKILAHPKPAQYALEIAQNQRMADPEFAKSRVEELREQIRKEEEAKALKKVQALLAKKSPSALGPKGVASLSSSTGSDTSSAKDIRKMSNAELEAAAFAEY